MKCNGCGHENDEGARFCQGCGSPLTGGGEKTDAGPGSVSCPKCGTENTADLKFCTGCGGPLVVGPEKDDTERLADELSETSREMAREAAAASARAAASAAKVGGSILGVVGVLLKRNWKIVVPIFVVVVVVICWPYIWPYIKMRLPVSNWIEPETDMKFIGIAGGCFQMGSPASEKERGDNEGPVHEVCLDGFQMGKYEVTQKQWRGMMGSNPSEFSGCDECPVENVSWDDVQKFIRKLNARGQGKYRLPTEAEWEYVCRSGGKPEKYCGGNDIDRLAWYSGNSGSKTHPVGQKAANGLGIYDMSGNVWEWVSDWYKNKYYADSPRENPQGPSGGSSRVFRGGRWNSSPAYVRSAGRGHGDPGYRDSSLGFRLARTSP